MKAANMQPNILVFRNIIRVPASDTGLRERAVAFWQERGFHFDAASGDEQIGRRGSTWGNLTSFNMSKLRATLTILTGQAAEAGASIDELNTGDERDEVGSRTTLIQFVLRVDTWMQHITEWNRDYWLLEMETAESWLLHGDKKEDQWRQFVRQSRRTSLVWAFTQQEIGTPKGASYAPTLKRSFPWSRIALTAILVGGLITGLRTVTHFTLNNALLVAVKEGDTARAERCLQRGANIEIHDHEGIDSPTWREDDYTPLALALARRDRAMVAMLLAHGANVQAKDEAWNGFPARDIILSTAVEAGQTDMVRMLLDKGAHVDVETGMHCTPLMLAARDNRLEIAKLLLDRGANVNARDDRGFHVIDFATGKHRQGHSEILKLLRSAGAK